MDWLRGVLRGVLSGLTFRKTEAKLDDELRHHIELETEKNIRAGMDPASARRRALVDFGGVERFKEQSREARPTRHLEELIRDVRYAFRRLARTPGPAAAVILCLGLGLGATAGVFSFFFGIVLRPLPFSEPERLVVLFETSPGATRASPSYSDFRGWQAESSAFSSLGAYGSSRRTLGLEGSPEILSGTRVSPEVFPILGIQPFRGRAFTREDDDPGAPATVILSHGLWQERFGGDPASLGQSLQLDGHPHTIIGVMPPGFAFPKEARYWVPMRTAASPSSGNLTAALGRLRDEFSFQAAREDMARVAAIMREAYPEANAEREIAVRFLEEDFLWGLKTPVTLFLLVAAFVLILATANVANLLLSQGASRAREMVVRASLGASRRRIVRQLLTENLLLAAGGGALGVALGVLGRDLYLSFLPEAFPYYLRFDLGPVGLVVLGLLTLGVGVLFGMAPALHATRPDLFSALRVGGELSDRNRLRSVLLGLQAGLALAVLVGAGMMATSLHRLQGVSTGLRPENLLTFQVALSEALRDDPLLQLAAFDEIRDRLLGLPGVTHAAVVSNLPVGGGAAFNTLYPEGTPVPPPGQEPMVVPKQVHPGYFATMGIQILEGRVFREGEGAPGTNREVIVNESYALRYWPEGGALGKRIKYGRPESEFPWMEIVGVAADVRHFGREVPVQLGIYTPFATFPYWREFLVVKTSTEPSSIMEAARRAVWAVDPGAPVYAMHTMEEILYRSHWRPVVLSRLLWIFSGVALVLATLGVYGVVSFFAARREKEFGVRMALGADPKGIALESFRPTILPCGSGFLGGLVVAFLGVRLASSIMFGVEGLEGSVAAVGVLLMAAVAGVATYLPARRAARMDPAMVLRDE